MWLFYCFNFEKKYDVLTLKRFGRVGKGVGGGEGCDFYYYNKFHIFPENFIEIPQVVQKIQRLSLSILAILSDFH